MRSKGFALIELILVIAIVLALSVLGASFYSRFLTQNAVANTTDQLVGMLRKAQTYAMMSRKSSTSGWGVALEGSYLTLYQGTNSLPVVVGYQTVGSLTDTGDSNSLNGTRLTTGVNGGSVVSGSVHVASVNSSPNNLFQLALYADNAGVPGALIAQSSAGTLTANSWNTLPLSANIAPNTSFWLVYNSNGLTTGSNNIHYNPTGSPLMAYSSTPQTYGTWPASFPSPVLQNFQLSMYVTMGDRNVELDERFHVNSNVGVSGLGYIDFARVSGEPSSGATITISGQGTTKIVEVNSLGVVSRQ